MRYTDKELALRRIVARARNAWHLRLRSTDKAKRQGLYAATIAYIAAARIVKYPDTSIASGNLAFSAKPN